MAKGTALVKARDRFGKLIKLFPENESFYLGKIEELNAAIVAAKVCRRCGRPISDTDAMEVGYGKDCLAKMEADASEKGE